MQISDLKKFWEKVEQRDFDFKAKKGRQREYQYHQVQSG